MKKYIIILFLVQSCNQIDKGEVVGMIHEEPKPYVVQSRFVMIKPFIMTYSHSYIDTTKERYVITVEGMVDNSRMVSEEYEVSRLTYERLKRGDKIDIRIIKNDNP